ncbi:hypothetical protein ACJ41O_014574 [Fusarium nematophilum]
MPIASLLKAALDVYRVVRSAHDEDGQSLQASDLSPLADALSVSVRDIKGQTKGGDGLEEDKPYFLAKFACITIGEDLIVHIERVLSSPNANGLIHVGLWSQENVDALGVRLREVIRHFQELALVDPDNVPDDILQHALVKPPPTDHASPLQDTAVPNGQVNPAPDANPTPTDNKARATLSRLAPAGLINDFILDSLSYKSMHDRENQVTEAHSQTLEWIFDNSPLPQPLRGSFRDSFISWLKTTDLGPIYWITGKPGSGKSTLMRFLSQHPTAVKHLRHWAAGKSICTAGFFFWTSGSREQRSQTGLLRYLLHQLLSSNPELVAPTFPDLWGRLRRMSTKERINLVLEWSVSDLKDAFHAFLDVAVHMNICLFIDGLDEFEGDHLEIINFFRGLTLRQNGDALKMCLSSRAWAVFEEAFENSVPSTRLQDLSHDDMCRYVKDALRGSAHLRKLMKKDEGLGHSLILEAVERADGVFLWVRLAVERMLSAFKTRNEVGDLESTLKALPTELDSLFQKLLFEDQTQSEVLETAALFQLMHARELVADFIKDESSTSLAVWELAFSLHPEDDDLALELDVHEATDEEIQSRCESTAIYIRERFAGLLGIHQQMGNMRVPKFSDENRRVGIARLLAGCKVTYIHRTVRDWLMEANGAGERLKALHSGDFDPHLRLLRSYVLRLKFSLEEIEHHRRLDEWYPDIALAMSHARYVTNDTMYFQRRLLNEMNKTLSFLWLEKASDPFDHWARNTFGSYEVRMKAPPIHRPFLCLATKFGLAKYVCEELEDLDVSEEENNSTPLLCYAVEFLCSRNKTIFPLSSPKLAQYLLAHPSNVNPGPSHTYLDFTTRQPTTPWLTLLRHLRDARRRGWIQHYDVNPEGIARWAEMVRMFIEVGYADVNAVIAKDPWDPEITALGVMELLEDTYGSAEVSRIRKLVEQRQNEN